MKFSTDDCVEIYYALDFYGAAGENARAQQSLLKKIGVDGKLMAARTSHDDFFTQQEAQKVYFSVMSKREALLEGEYDEEPNEVRKIGSETYRWERQFSRILGKLARAYGVPLSAARDWRNRRRTMKDE